MTPAGRGGLHGMTTFVLLHGSGDGGWAWHLVRRALDLRGHDSRAPDLPTDRDDVTWDDVASAGAEGGPTADVVVVAHSAGGFVAPLVAERLDARLVVHVAGLVPRAGQSATSWFDDVDLGAIDPDPTVTWYHDVDPALAARAVARERPTSARLAAAPWPSADLLADRSRYVVTARDRFLPPRHQRRVAAERLGIEDPDEIATGHCPALARPDELAELLVRIAG